jgi:DNA-binding response OmpR family regulator
MHETVAVVDDEPDILELVSLHLRKNHFRVREFSDGSSFIKYLNSEIPDLVVLDLMLPDADGFEICKYMKRKKNLSPFSDWSWGPMTMSGSLSPPTS